MIKRILSVLLVLLVVFACCGTAFADTKAAPPEEQVQKEEGNEKAEQIEWVAWKDNAGWVIAVKRNTGEWRWYDYLRSWLPHTETKGYVYGKYCIIWTGTSIWPMGQVPALWWKDR